jgi:hypothetical protein
MAEIQLRALRFFLLDSSMLFTRIFSHIKIIDKSNWDIVCYCGGALAHNFNLN